MLNHSDEPAQSSGLRQSAHWAALLTSAAGAALLCGGDYSLDHAVGQLASPPLIAAGLFWLVELVLALTAATPDRGLVAAPVIALIGFGLVITHTPFQLAWSKSKDAFDHAAAELRQHPGDAPNFRRALGVWDIDLVQAEPGSDSLYFEVAGDGPNRPVFANVPGAKSADWSSYRDCEKIDGDWYRCAWRY